MVTVGTALSIENIPSIRHDDGNLVLNPQKAFLLLTLVSIVALAYRAIVLLFFHPLSPYPGPLIGRVTGLYHTFHAWKKDNARNFYNLHEKYGPVVRYAPNGVSIRSHEGVRMLYVNSRYTRKSDSYLAFPRNPEKASLFSAINKAAHARKRRLLRHGFSDSALRAAEITIKRHVATLCQCLEHLENDNEGASKLHGSRPQSQNSEWSTPKNFSEWINRFTFDVSSDLSFSKSFHMMKYEENRHIIKIVHETLWADNVTGSAINLLHKWKLKSLFFPRQIRSTSHFDSFVYKAAGDRLGSKGNETTKDFMYWFTDAVSQENGESFTMEELVEEGILLITAGSDTSSTAMAATLFYLLRTPHALEKLQNEIRSVFHTVSSISFGPLLQSCTYLRACIDEGLRLAPPAGSVLHRQVEAGGVVVGSAFFPGNTDIGVPVFALHHDRTYFPDPFKFQPERWIVGETLTDGSKVTEAALRHSESAFMPFSAGTRGCIGKPLALLQMSIVFATLMLKYDLRLCKERWVNGLRSGIGPDPSEEFELVDTFISWKSGPLVEVRAREVAE